MAHLLSWIWVILVGTAFLGWLCVGLWQNPDLRIFIGALVAIVAISFMTVMAIIEITN